MQEKKKQVANLESSAPMKVRAIRLRPSATDYEAFAETTAIAMGGTMNQASKRKPNKRLLSLLNLGI